MSPRAPRDLLEELRTYLEHFDESGHLGDDADVAEIKRRLRMRIAEVDGIHLRQGRGGIYFDPPCS